MAYRRDKEEALRWRRWLDASRDRLLDCGVPSMAFEDQRTWGYFIEHGQYPLDEATVIIDVDEMPKEQALKLGEFLEEDEKPGCDPSFALNRLQYLLGRGKHAR